MKPWPVLRLIAFDHCYTLAPWCRVRNGATPALRVRRIAHELEQASRPRRSRLESGLAQLLFLAVSLRQVVMVWRPERRGTKAHYGVGIVRQFRDLLRLAWQGNLPPRVYYFQRLFRHADPAVHLSVVEHRELQVLLRAVHAGADIRVLADKMDFHAFCGQHSLPTPPILVAYVDGQPAPGGTVSPADWQRDLFSKPARSYASLGVASWRYDPASQRHTDGKLTLNRTELETWFAQQSRGQTLIVQPRLGNAPDLQSITGHALANCRVVTARRPDGSIFVLLAALRIGLGKAITSDDPIVMFCAAVNPETGVMGPGETKTAAKGSFTHHPESGAAIAGRALPRWPQMRDLALRAHAALPQLIFVGWDVVDTERGPMLLEGNLIWGGNLAQMSGNPPLGVTEFPEIILHYYKPGTAALLPPTITCSDKLRAIPARASRSSDRSRLRWRVRGR